MEQDPNPFRSPESPGSQSRLDLNDQTYWKKSLRIVAAILIVWASVSLGGGILLRDWLDATLPNVGGAPFGFWIAQQGAIIMFLILLVVYMLLMNRLDNQFGYREGEGQ